MIFAGLRKSAGRGPSDPQGALRRVLL